MTTKARVVSVLNAICPIVDVDFDEGAQRINAVNHGGTPQQQAALRAAISAFDYSDAAQQAWEDAQNPTRKDLNDAAAQAIQDLDDYLALASPTNAQVLAIVRKLAQQNKRIIARLIQV